MKNKTLYALWKYKVAFLVFIIIGFLAGFFVTSFIINNNFSYYETTIKTDVATNLVFNQEYFETRIEDLKSYNIINKDKKISYTTSADYTTIAKNIKIEELDNNEYIIRITKKYFSDTFVSSTLKVSEGITKCKNSITAILTKPSEGEYAPKYNVEITSDFNLVGYNDPYFYGGITAASMLVLSIAFFFILSKGKNEDYFDDISDNENIFKTPFHKKYWAGSLKCFKNVRDLTILAMLFGMMLLMKMINLPSGFGALGLGFTYLFFAIIAMIYGPVAGLVIGAFSDILGYFIFPQGGQAFFIGYTLDAMTAGFIYGICFYKTKLTFNKCLYARLFVNLVTNVIFGSLWWGIINNFTFDAYLTYVTVISLPKNLIYLLPQTILLFIVLKAMTRPLSAFGLIDMRVREHVTLF